MPIRWADLRGAAIEARRASVGFPPARHRAGDPAHSSQPQRLRRAGAYGHNAAERNSAALPRRRRCRWASSTPELRLAARLDSGGTSTPQRGSRSVPPRSATRPTLDASPRIPLLRLQPLARQEWVRHRRPARRGLRTLDPSPARRDYVARRIGCVSTPFIRRVAGVDAAEGKKSASGRKRAKTTATAKVPADFTFSFHVSLPTHIWSLNWLRTVVNPACHSHLPLST